MLGLGSEEEDVVASAPEFQETEEETQAALEEGIEDEKSQPGYDDLKKVDNMQFELDEQKRAEQQKYLADKSNIKKSHSFQEPDKKQLSDEELIESVGEVAATKADPTNAIDKEVNRDAKSPYQKGYKDQYLDVMEKMQALMSQKNPEPSTADKLADTFATLYNLSARIDPRGQKEIKHPNMIKKSRQRSLDKKKSDLTSLDTTRKLLGDLMQIDSNIGKSNKGTLKELDDGRLVRVMDDNTVKEVDTGMPATSKRDRELELERDKAMVKEEAKDTYAQRKEVREERKAAEKALNKLPEVKKDLARARELLKKANMTGPVDQVFASLGDKESQELRRILNGLALDKMASLFQGMSKAIDSDGERKFFMDSQATMGVQEEVNLAKLDQLERELTIREMRLGNFLDSTDRDGKYTKELKGWRDFRNEQLGLQKKQPTQIKDAKGNTVHIGEVLKIGGKRYRVTGPDTAEEIK